MCFGTIVGWTEKTSEYSVTTDIAGFIFMGIAPFALGVGLLAIGILLQLRRRRVEERNDNAAYSPKN
jgi:hypothetical protein